MLSLRSTKCVVSSGCAATAAAMPAQGEKGGGGAGRSGATRPLTDWIGAKDDVEGRLEKGSKEFAWLSGRGDTIDGCQPTHRPRLVVALCLVAARTVCQR